METPVKVNNSNWLETLRAIQKHSDLKTAAKSIETKYQTLYKRAILLEKVGLVHSVKAGNRRTWGLTEWGREYLIKPPSWGAGEVKLTRLHANAFTFEILNKPDNWDTQKPKIMMQHGTEIKQIRLNNNTQEFLYFFDTTAKVTTKKVIIYINDVYGKNAAECDTGAIKKLSKVFPKYERKLKRMGVTIRKPSYGVSAANTAHYAKEHNRFAEVAHESGGTILVRDRVDGKRRVISDESKGYPELEAVHPSKSRDDIDAIERLLEGALERDVFSELDTIYRRFDLTAKVIEKHSNEMAKMVYTFSQQAPQETTGGWN